MMAQRREMRQVALAVAVAVATCTCGDVDSGTVRAPITNGTVEIRHPEVVAIIPSCTGTLVAPRVVLTAAHCIGAHEGAVFFGSDKNGRGELRSIIDERTHPDYDRLGGLIHDVGVVLLDEPAPPKVTPALLPVAPPPATFSGESVLVVGFGYETSTDETFGIKRSGTARVTEVDATTFSVEGAPSLPCSGDSGGPAFASHNGVEVIVGVTSSGDINCASRGTSARVDIYVDDFVRPYIAATEPGAAGLGQRCFDDENCTTGACRFPSDAPSIGYCTTSCQSDAECPDGLRCEGDGPSGECRFPLPSPGAQGAACEIGSDCHDRVCSQETDGSAAVCARPCSPSGEACPDGFDCRVDPSRPAGYGCFAEVPAQGCSVGGGSPTAGLLALLVLLLVLRFRAWSARGVATMAVIAISGCGVEPASPLCAAGTCTTDPLPGLLSETGLYADVATGEVGADVRGYVPRFPLWTDGAEKQRWIYLPPNSTIDTSEIDYWRFPVGTILWKEFVRDGVRVETRILAKTSDEPQGWGMGAYVWDESQLDAVLTPSGAENVLGTAHDVPSGIRCPACHGRMPDKVIGFSAIQLGANTSIGIDALAEAGKISHVPAAPLEVPGAAEVRAALGYLHGNCGSCHQPRGGLRIDLDLSLAVGSLASVEETPAYVTSVGVAVADAIDGAAERIRPGHPEDSSIYLRMAAPRDQEISMPSIGTEDIDESALESVDAWIRSLEQSPQLGEL